MTPEDKTTLQTAASEVADDVKLALALLAALKAKDKAALAALVPQAVAEVREDVAAFRAAAPVIKAGHRSTEFWLVVGVIAITALFPAISGKSLALDQEGIIAAVTAVYTIARTFAKKGAA